MIAHPVMYLMATMMGASARLMAPPSSARIPVRRLVASFASMPIVSPPLLKVAACTLCEGQHAVGARRFVVHAHEALGIRAALAASELGDEATGGVRRARRRI